MNEGASGGRSKAVIASHSGGHYVGSCLDFSVGSQCLSFQALGCEGNSRRWSGRDKGGLGLGGKKWRVQCLMMIHPMS